MKILEELYYGNISPNEKRIKRGSQYDSLLSLLCRNEDVFTSTLSKEQKILYDKVKECREELATLTEKEMYIEGFRLGACIAFDAVCGTSDQFTRS